MYEGIPLYLRGGGGGRTLFRMATQAEEGSSSLFVYLIGECYARERKRRACLFIHANCSRAVSGTVCERRAAGAFEFS